MEFRWPTGNGSGGSPYFIDPVDTVGDLPATAPEGTLVLVIDEDALYERRGGVWVLFVDPGQLQADIDAAQAAADAAQDDIDNHVADLNNPHATTKAQVGLGNADNTSDANKPVSTAQQAALDLKQNRSEKGQPLGYASLDAGGLIPVAQLPPVAITDTFVVNSQAAQVALTAEVGDVAVRTDQNKSYILRATPASTFSNWQELLTPTDSVLSVNGFTGAVTLSTADIAESGNLYFTDERAQDAVGNNLLDTASINLTYNDGTGQISADLLPAGVDKNTLGGSALSIGNGGTGQTNKTSSFNALSPNTAKGDLVSHDGTNSVRLATGLYDGQVLVKDSATSSGLNYKAPVSLDNYIANGGFEDSPNGVQPTGWVLYADAAGAAPVDGTGGSPTGIGFFTSISSPLRGNVSCVFSKDAANRQGMGTSSLFSISPLDVNKKLQISVGVAVAGGTYVAGDMAIYVYDTTNNVLITPSLVSIPSATGTWGITFDSTTSLTYRLILHIASTSAVAYDLKFDDIAVNDGELFQGAVVGPEITTGDVVLSDFANATGVTITGGGVSYIKYQRVGDSLRLSYRFALGGVGTVASPFTFNLGAWITRSLGVSLGSLTQPQEHAGCGFRQATEARVLLGTLNTDGTLIWYIEGQLAALRGTDVGSGTTGDYSSVTGELTVPIGTWTSSGTFAAAVDEEFAFNTSTITTGSDTTSFGTGPQGVPFYAVTAAGDRRVRFSRPKQQGDKDFLEVSQDNGLTWFDPNSNGLIESCRQGSLFYGMNIRQVPGSLTDVDVAYRQYRAPSSSATYASAGATWSDLTGGIFRWRVRRVSAKAPAGVKKASDGESGLIPYYNEAAVTPGGDFSGGSVKVVRIGSTVTVSFPLLNHASSVAPASASGIIPVWARPSDDRRNVYNADANSVSCNVEVQADGDFVLRYYSAPGAGVARTTSLIGGAIVYNV